MHIFPSQKPDREAGLLATEAGAKPGLLSLRAAVILFLATVIAVVAALLTYWDQDSIASALLAGGATWGGSVAIFQQLIGA